MASPRSRHGQSDRGPFATLVGLIMLVLVIAALVGMGKAVFHTTHYANAHDAACNTHPYYNSADGQNYDNPSFNVSGIC